MMIFGTPKCGSSVVNTIKIDDFQVLILTPFGSHFGGVLGAQMEAKAIKKPFKKKSKNDVQNEPNMVPKSGPGGFQSVNNQQ